MIEGMEIFHDMGGCCPLTSGTIHAAAPEGLPGDDSVTNQGSLKELSSQQPLQNSEEASFVGWEWVG